MNRRGFTILELIIVSGLASLMALQFAEMIMNNNKSMQSARQTQEFWGLISTIGLVTETPNACAQALKTQKIGGPVRLNMPGQVLEAGSKIGKLTIEKVELVQTAPVAGTTDQFFAGLRVEGRKSGGTMLLQKEVTLRVKVAGGEVVDCQSAGLLTLPQICEAFNGVFNTSTQKCEV